MSDEAYGLLLAFDSDDASFVRGVEVGRVWEILHRADELLASGIACAHGCGREGLVEHADGRQLCLPCYSAEVGLDDPREPEVIAAAQRCEVCRV